MSAEQSPAPSSGGSVASSGGGQAEGAGVAGGRGRRLQGGGEGPWGRAGVGAGFSADDLFLFQMVINQN